MSSPRARALAVQIDDTREKILQLALQVPPETHAPGEGEKGWSAAQILCHIAESEAFFNRFILMLRDQQEGVIGRSRPEDEEARLTAPARHGDDPIDQIVAAVRRVATETHALIVALTDEQLAHTGRWADGRTVTLEQMLLARDGHLREHVAQLEQLVALV